MAPWAGAAASLWRERSFRSSAHCRDALPAGSTPPQVERYVEKCVTPILLIDLKPSSLPTRRSIAAYELIRRARRATGIRSTTAKDSNLKSRCLEVPRAALVLASSPTQAQTCSGRVIAESAANSLERTAA